MAHTGYIGMNDNDIMLGELRQGQADIDRAQTAIKYLQTKQE